MNEQNWIDLIVEARSKRRKYAAFNEWPDKAIKEKSIVSDLLEAMTAQGDRHGIIQIRSNEPDPPDCVGICEDGKQIAFEVTELVDEDTILRHQYGETDWKEWNENELLSKIQEIIRDKDRKVYHGGPYSKIILLIHSDEPILRLSDILSFLGDQTVSQCKQITDCYLLLTYNPGLKAYPYFKLKIARLV